MKRLAIVSLVLVAACGGGDKDPKAGISMAVPNEAEKVAEDLAITTTDGSMTLAVRGDSLRLRLSDATREKVRSELDTAKVDGDGFGARIAKAVKSKVAQGIGMEMTIALSSIKAARLEGDRIVLESKETGKELFDGTQSNGKALVESFSNADAKKLVDFVQRRLGTP